MSATQRPKVEQGRTFRERQRSESQTGLFVVRGNDTTGRHAWYFVRVKRGMERKFETVCKQGFMNLSDYGTIIFSGYGQDPPDDIRQRMKDEYGFSEK